MERLLLIAERYIVTVEEGHTACRTILPHGASFQGTPIRLTVTCENPKTEFIIKVGCTEYSHGTHALSIAPVHIHFTCTQYTCT